MSTSHAAMLGITPGETTAMPQSVQQPDAQRVSAGVLLSGQMVTVALRAADITLRALARNERPREPLLEALHAVLSECVSECPRPDTANRTAEHTSGGKGWLSCGEAAPLLGCSDRTARRLATGLGGEKIAGCWMIDREALEEHLAGRNSR
jgi:hypothetical protein